MLIDIKKSFDTISWQFISHVLDFLNFGTSHKNRIRTFYSGIKACVIQHGIISTPYKAIDRGTQYLNTSVYYARTFYEY